MKIRITDDRLQNEEFILETSSDELDSMDDSPRLTQEEAFEVIAFWESSSEVAGRGSYDLTDDGIIVLAEVESLGDDIEMMAWYRGDVDYTIDGFPSITLHWEIVDDAEPAEPKKKFGELRSYPGMNGFPVTLHLPDGSKAVITDDETTVTRKDDS